MPLHPQIQPILAAERGAPAPSSIEEAREQYARTSLTYVGPGEPVSRVEDVDADGVPARVYVPCDMRPGETLPLVVWIHGGGWVLGTLDAHDSLCRALSNASGAVVCSVDYRLAPEARYPAQIEDCERVLRWAIRSADALGVDPARIAVAGDSAGGNLAAVLAWRARSDVLFQVLVYPATEAGCSTGSYDGFGDGTYSLSRDEMVLCWEAYAPGPLKEEPEASVLRAPMESLAGLPPALVLVAEYDPLTDDGLAYAARLRGAGVAAETKCYEGMIHGFFRWRGAVDCAHEAMEDAAAALRAALGSRRRSPLPVPASARR